MSFDLLGPLPQGTTVLEASAGTGKTFTIAGLVTRYVAEGVARLDELLVVTFGRAATQELRDRVRERLVSARDGLADPDRARAGSDALLRHLAAGSDAAVAIRRQRLVVALSSFDAATVVTTHQFCQQMLIGLGTAGDVDAGATLVENLDDLVDEVVQDLYLRKWGCGDPTPRNHSAKNAPRFRVDPGTVLVPPMKLAEAQQLAAAVVQDGQAILVPTAPQGEHPTVRLRFAQAVRAEVERRKRMRRILGFDDLLTRLQATLADPQTGPAATTRLRSRYRVVLVDEFQDTDPVQWDILRLAFHGAATLVLVGDPKQAIYAFRGADVQAYLAAAELAERRATLAENWRSDPDLLRGLDALFRGAALGDPRIVVAPLSAAHPGRLLESADPPVRIRLVRQGNRGAMGVDTARQLVTRDVVREVVTLLGRGPLLRPRDGAPARPVRPGDLAVIVRTGAQLDLVHQELVAAGVPSVQRTTSSVFRTSAGADWIVLLEALEQPHRSGRLRRLAISPFVGWDAAGLEHHDVDRLGLRLRHWLRVYTERGVAALFETLSRDEQLLARLLGQRDGERRLTDLRHVGEALHAATMAGQLGLTAALEWLRHRVEEAGEDSSVERSRRLDSDAAAVQVVTVHASKGLEFPIVYVPFGWDRHVFDPEIPLFHEESGRRVRNVGGKTSPGFTADQRRHNSEEFGEDLRLLYVALTRAQAQVTAWWAPSNKNTRCAPLHRLLFTESPAVEIPQRVPVPNDGVALTRAAARALDGCLSAVAVSEAEELSWQRPPAPTVKLTAAALGRPVDTSWRRTSYTALTAGAHDAAPVIGSEPELEEKDDEPATPAPPATDAAASEIVSPMDALPGGTAFGTLVHAVLERADPAADDLAAELSEHAAAQLARLGPAKLDVDVLVTALLPVLHTPLGPIAAGRALADIPAADRLTEVEFELPLCGGDRPSGTARLGDLAALLRAELPSDDPLAAYGRLLADPALGDAELKGYLTGSIDAVMRVDGRYVVIDYKTNRLGVPDAPLTAWDYRTAAMTEAMLHAHYPLQALLYDVALHRFLRWRLADYDPRRHLGGVLYLFLRGMCGPDVVLTDGTVPGVFGWRPPPSLVVAASEVLAGGRR
ncbi:MAG TPA: UvrD-helicase domain-containing protein [Jatrophihabitans sp.]|nr:UvrD-helicase domain-containing protein [Jatrophihabitans sp.]